MHVRNFLPLFCHSGFSHFKTFFLLEGFTMAQTFTRPVSDEQQKALDKKKLPSQEEINSAADWLFMNLLERVEKLEKDGDST